MIWCQLDSWHEAIIYPRPQLPLDFQNITIKLSALCTCTTLSATSSIRLWNEQWHSYYCWIEPKYNELRTALNFTARLRFGTFSNKFIHQNANLAPLHWDFLHWMFQHLNFLNEKLKNNNFTCNLVNAGHWLLGWPKQL